MIQDDGRGSKWGMRVERRMAKSMMIQARDGSE